MNKRFLGFQSVKVGAVKWLKFVWKAVYWCCTGWDEVTKMLQTFRNALK